MAMNATAPSMASDDDLYSDGPEKAPEPPAEKEEAQPEGQDDSIEATLPRGILGGKTFEVGDEVVLKITAMHDNEIAVKYAPAKKDDGEGEGAAEKGGDEMGAGDPEYD